MAVIILVGFPSVYGFAIVPNLQLDIWKLCFGLFSVGLTLYVFIAASPLAIRESAPNNASPRRLLYASVGISLIYVSLIFLKYYLFGGTFGEMLEFSAGLLIPFVAILLGVILNENRTSK